MPASIDNPPSSVAIHGIVPDLRASCAIGHPQSPVNPHVSAHSVVVDEVVIHLHPADRTGRPPQ